MRIIFLLAIALTGCTGTQTLTPEQLAQYQKTVHAAVQGGIQDYKEIKPLVK